MDKETTGSNRGLNPPGRDEPPSFAAGTAGGSARREYERRKTRDEEKMRLKWGRFGGLAVALADERPQTASWARGAIGEERLGARLNELAADSVNVLHDRRIPGSKANIDHIIVTTAGVWVIDAKRYKGRPELTVEGGFMRPRVEKLLVGRRDRTHLVDGVLKQVGFVHNALEGVPVTGVLCFVEADWPLVGGAFHTRGVHVLWPKRLTRVITGTAAAGVDVRNVSAALDSRFTPAR